jgi:DNA (cytosine-5)-methyltransferase 1
MNGLDLFSGIGGITLALAPWVRPVTYCENDRYCQAVLLSRMADGELPWAPIWDDVRTLLGVVSKPVDIIYGGFPCQDISVAGNGRGLEGERSGLVNEIFRLVDEISPSFIFLENVPAIRTRGAEQVGKELSGRGYDCRWDVVSAAEVGAPHLRKRWFLLAHANGQPVRDESGRRAGSIGQSATQLGFDGASRPLADAGGARCGQGESGASGPLRDETRRAKSERLGGDVADPVRAGSPRRGSFENGTNRGSQRGKPSASGWWATEPNVGRVAHGIPHRVDRIRGLGNAVVPAQAREAFKRLMCLRVDTMR